MISVCKQRYKGIAVFCAFFILFAATAYAAKSPSKSTPQNKTAPKPAEPFSLEVPTGWTFSQAGDCDTLTLFLHNPAQPLQQLFFFPRFGPVYMNQEQKAQDLQLESISGRNLSRRDMPVIDPLTPENFARFLPQIFQMKNMREFMPDRPGLRIVESISAYPQKPALEYIDTRTAIIRIVFVQDNRLGEGIIAITTVPSPEFRNDPGGGIGMGYLLYGLTAPKGELTAALPTLLAAGRSFKLSAEQGKKCKIARAEDLPTLLSEGQSLKLVLDALSTSWEKRQLTEDILSEKKADALRGMERLYLPSTADVYEFPIGFADEYLQQPERYSLTGLKPLPDEPALWLKQPLNGTKSVTKK